MKKKIHDSNLRFYSWPDYKPEKYGKYMTVCSDITVENGVIKHGVAYFQECYYSFNVMNPHWCIDSNVAVLYWAEIPELPEGQE